MTADRLHEAARVLRERFEAATAPDEMHPYGNRALPALPASAHPDEVRALLGGTWGDYYATMHPGVGFALADWLDTAGADLWAHGPLCECGSGCLDCDDLLWQPHARRALALADLILGGAS